MSGLRRYPLLFSLLLASISAHAALVTFNDFTPLGVLQTVISSEGLTFTTTNTMAVWNAASTNSNGTPGLIDSGGVVTISLTAGGEFNLESFLMTISWYNTNTSEPIPLTAHYSGGASATQTITLIQGLQPFYVNLTGVTSVDVGSLGGGYWLMDNVTYSTGAAIPEPGTFALAGALLALLALTRLRRRAGGST